MYARLCACVRVGAPTGLAQHVGEADVGADGGVHLHPGRHGVQLAVVVQLVQEFLNSNTTSTQLQHNLINTADSGHVVGMGLLPYSERCGVLSLSV